jgi:hypothetical protein
VDHRGAGVSPAAFLPILAIFKKTPKTPIHVLFGGQLQA